MMKKLMTGLLAAMMILSLAACGGSPTPATTQTPPPTPNTPTKTPLLPPSPRPAPRRQR